MRIDAIARWSRSGVVDPREKFPIEHSFSDRVRSFGGQFFTPIEIPHSHDTRYNTQVSYLVDSYDFLPARVDLAFDFAWKAFEALVKRGAEGVNPSSYTNTTDSLWSLAKDSASVISTCRVLAMNIPSQSCEHLYKRLIQEKSPLAHERRARKRLEKRTQEHDELGPLISSIYAKYAKSTQGPRFDRRGAMLLRRALNGEYLEIDDKGIQLSPSSQAHLILSGLLYTVRNERYHGESFSPFISSAATLKTYTHCHFIFICAYALTHTIWAESSSLGISNVEVRNNLIRNIDEARSLYGRHWNK